MKAQIFSTDHRIYLSGTSRHHHMCLLDGACIAYGAGDSEPTARAACIAAAERVALELADWILKEKAK